MAEGATAMEGRCLCGAVTIRVATHGGDVGACHCGMCRRWSGGVFFSLHAPASAVTVEGEVRRYQSSPFAERAFCPACGSHLWFRETGSEDAEYELMPGLFAAARGLPLAGETYIDRAPAWAALAGEHPRRTRAAYEAGQPFVEGDAP